MFNLVCSALRSRAIATARGRAALYPPVGTPTSLLSSRFPRLGTDARNPLISYGARSYSSIQSPTNPSPINPDQKMSESEEKNIGEGFLMVRRAIWSLIFIGTFLMLAQPFVPYIRARTRITKKSGLHQRNIATLKNMATDKKWIKERLQQAKQFNLGNVDRSADIADILKIHPRQLIIVEGMREIGKTTCLLKLCEDQVEKGEPVFYLHFRVLAKMPEAESIFDEDPVAVLEMADSFKKQKKQLTIVIDDFMPFLQGQENAHTGAALTQLFVDLAKSGARVLLTCSGDGLLKTLRSLPYQRSMEAYRYQMLSPSAEVITKLITDNEIQTKEQKAQEENSSKDISRFCEVVGTHWQLESGFRNGNSVRDMTHQVFRNEVLTIAEHLSALLSYPGEVHRLLLSETTRAFRKLGVASTKERALLKKLLEELCEKQYVVGCCNVYSLCELLVKHGILRPAGSTHLTWYYEFSSFACEVAVRALLGKPFVEHDLHIPHRITLESHGRGSEETINFLTAACRESFNAVQSGVQELLNKSSRGDKKRSP